MPVKMMMTACGSSTDMVAMHGVDKTQLSRFKTFEVGPQAMAAFRTSKHGALVGNRIAIRYGWEEGEQVTIKELGGVSLTVCGIFTTHGTSDDFLIYAGRRFVQEATDEQGISNHVLVKLTEGADADAVAGAIDALPLTVETTTRLEEAHLGVVLDNLADLAAVSRSVCLITVLVVLIAIGNAVSMSTRDRTAEFGVLRTLGYKRPAIMGMVMGEGLLQAAVGAAAGCGLVQALTSLNLIKTISTCSITIVFSAGPGVWSQTLGAVLAATLLGCAVPAWRASRVDPVTAIRRDD